VNTPTEREEALSSKRKPLIPARRVWERFNVTDRTLARWLENPNLNFPPPTMIINGRRYWDEEVVDTWEQERAATQTEAA
jgi:predicted DNA-binding transcriptional regulator AlpA